MNEEPGKMHFMKQAYEQAELAYSADEVPVGAVVVMENEIIGRGYNGVIRESDPTAHAEILALRDASRRQQNYRLSGSDLYVTLEPCLMCYAAMVHARVNRLYFGAFDKKTGVYSTGSYDKLPGVFNHSIEVGQGLLQEESSRLLKQFFKVRRGAGAVERDGLENR